MERPLPDTFNPRWSAAFDAAAELHNRFPDVSGFADWEPDAKPSFRAPFTVPVAEQVPQDQRLYTEDLGHVRDAFAAVWDLAMWRQTYSAEQVGQDFLNRFGCYELIGPDGHFQGQTLRSFVLYSDADLYYEWHSHPAEELYFVIAGEALFEAEGQSPKILTPGCSAFHASGQRHRMTALDVPVMAYVLWRGEDMSTKPVLDLP